MDVKTISIANIKAGMNKLTLKAIILKMRKKTLKRDRYYFDLKIADKSGCCSLTLFDLEICALLKRGDIILLKDCFANIFNGQLRLRVRNEMTLLKMGDFCMEFDDTIDISQLKTIPKSKATISSSSLAKNQKDQKNSQKIGNDLKPNVHAVSSYRIPKLTRPTEIVHTAAAAAAAENRKSLAYYREKLEILKKNLKPKFR